MKDYLTDISSATEWRRIIRDLRIESNFSQRKLAELCNMPQRTLAEYENLSSTRELSINKVEKILDCLGYEIDVFLKGGEREKPKTSKLKEVFEEVSSTTQDIQKKIREVGQSDPSLLERVEKLENGLIEIAEIAEVSEGSGAKFYGMVARKALADV